MLNQVESDMISFYLIFPSVENPKLCDFNLFLSLHWRFPLDYEYLLHVRKLLDDNYSIKSTRHLTGRMDASGITTPQALLSFFYTKLIERFLFTFKGAGEGWR